MGNPLSVPQVLADLEAQMARLEGEEALHAERETFHREERARSAAELVRLRERYAAFKAAAAAIEEVVTQVPPADPKVQEDEDARLPIPSLSRLIAHVVEERPPGERFTGASVAQEINRRFARRLHEPLTSRTAAVTLRRLRDAGRIQLVHAGTAFNESIYVRVPRPGVG
jgi:hypothetical protein